MPEASDPDFEKIFSEIVNSDELKGIQEEYETNVKFGLKELMLIQQSLSDVISHVSEIMMQAINGENLFDEDSIYHNLLSSIYKISEDFNECMLEYYSDLNDLDDLEGDENTDDDSSS